MLILKYRNKTLANRDKFAPLKIIEQDSARSEIFILELGCEALIMQKELD